MQLPMIEPLDQKIRRLAGVESADQGGGSVVDLSGVFTPAGNLIQSVITGGAPPAAYLPPVSVGDQVNILVGAPPALIQKIDSSVYGDTVITLNQNQYALNGDKPFTVSHGSVLTLSLRLISDGSLVLNEATSRADLLAAECISADYPAGGFPIVWKPGQVTDGVAYSMSGLLTFRVATPVPAQTVYGAWIDDGSRALQRVALATPVPLTSIGDIFACLVSDGYPPGEVGIEILDA